MTDKLTQAARVSGTIKALQWEDLGADYWRAPAPLFGTICIEPWGGLGFQVLWSEPGFCSLLIADLFPSPEAAKAAAQADYNARILAAIQPDPEPSVRDALQVIADIPSTMNGSFDHGLEVAYRAVEALFDKPPMIVCSPIDPEPQPVAQDTICDDCGKLVRHNTAHWMDDGASYCPSCRPLPATPSSAGMVSVEAWTVETNITPWAFLSIEQMRAFEASTGELERLSLNGEWIPTDTPLSPGLVYRIRPAALRALAGERG